MESDGFHDFGMRAGCASAEPKSPRTKIPRMLPTGNCNSIEPRRMDFRVVMAEVNNARRYVPGLIHFHITTDMSESVQIMITGLHVGHVE